MEELSLPKMKYSLQEAQQILSIQHSPKASLYPMSQSCDITGHSKKRRLEPMRIIDILKMINTPKAAQSDLYESESFVLIGGKKYANWNAALQDNNSDIDRLFGGKPGS